jgi:hypothetical protein
MERIYWMILTLGIALACTGCSSSSPQEANPRPTEPRVPPIEAITDTPESQLQLGNTPKVQEMPSNPPPVEKFVSLAKADLARRLGKESDPITVVKTAEMLWPDAALGCPRPEKVYPPGRVPGFQIWLETNGTEYIYNTDFNGQVILCPELNPDIPNSIIGPTPNIGVPIP